MAAAAAAMASPASPEYFLPLPRPPGRLVANASHSPTPLLAAPLPMPPRKPAKPQFPADALKPVRNEKKSKSAMAKPAMSPINAKAMEAAASLQLKPLKKPRRRCSCCLCCALASLVLVGVALCIVLAGTLMYVTLRPELLQFRIEKPLISALDIAKTLDFSYLTTNIDLFVAILNKNEDIAFDYKGIKVYLSSDDANLGRAELAGISQAPNNLTIEKFHIGVANSLVSEGDGRRLKAKFDENNLVLDVELQGQIRATIRKIRTSYFSIRVRCLGIDYSKAALGIEGKCEIYALGW